MAWKIYIEKAKPNPKGKDTSGNHPLAKQLLGEWVDLKNTGDQSVALSRIYMATAVVMTGHGDDAEARRDDRRKTAAFCRCEASSSAAW